MDSMANNSKTEESTQVKIWGIPLDKAVSLLQTVGIPTLFMLFICFMLYQYVPTVVKGHVDLLQRTGDTLEKMDETLKQSSNMVEEIIQVQRETKTFMKQVNIAHEAAQKDLTTIKTKVVGNDNN